jgi:hypothetical protein
LAGGCLDPARRGIEPELLADDGGSPDGVFPIGRVFRDEAGFAHAIVALVGDTDHETLLGQLGGHQRAGNHSEPLSQ